MKIQNQLGYIKGITFAPFHRRGSLLTQHTQKRFVTLPVPHSQMKN